MIDPLLERKILSILIACPKSYQIISKYFDMFREPESIKIIQVIIKAHEKTPNYDLPVIGNIIMGGGDYNVSVLLINEYFDEYVSDANLKYFIDRLCLRELKGSLVTYTKDFRNDDNVNEIKYKIKDIFESIQTIDEVEIEDGKKEYIQMVEDIEKNIIEPKVYSGHIHIEDSNDGYDLNDYIIIGGGESVGKTSFILDLICKQIMNDIPVGLFECEMKRQKIYHILACKVAGINPKSVQKNIITKLEKESLKNALIKLYEKPLYVYDNTRNWEEIKNKSIIMKEKYGVKVFYHDYLQYLRLPDVTDQYQRLEIISAETKQLCKDLNTPIVQVSSLSRTGKGCEPENFHIKGNGDIEYNADIIGLLWKIEDHVYGDYTKRKVGFKFSKNRNGELFRTEYIFNCALRRFEKYLTD